MSLLQCKMCNYGCGSVCSTDATEYWFQQAPVDWQHSCRSALLGYSNKRTVCFSRLRLACWLHLLWGRMCVCVCQHLQYFISCHI